MHVTINIKRSQIETKQNIAKAPVDTVMTNVPLHNFGQILLDFWCVLLKRVRHSERIIQGDFRPEMSNPKKVWRNIKSNCTSIAPMNRKPSFITCVNDLFRSSRYQIVVHPFIKIIE